MTRCGVDFQLTGEQAALWLNGRFGFAKNRENVPEVKALQQLKRQGLVEITEGDEPVFEYRALTQCVLTPAKPQGVRAILSARQKELLLWLTEAGLRLTTAELVFLTEHHVAPQINLLGDRNRQNLTETIYTQETIFDNILEAQMEHAAVRDEVVSAIAQAIMMIRSSAEPQAGFVGQHGESGYAIQHLSNPQVCTCLLLRYNKSVFQVRAVSGRSR